MHWQRLTGLLIALHAEDELIIRENAAKYSSETDFKYHSIIQHQRLRLKQLIW